jgi:hypothetical protein
MMPRGLFHAHGLERQVERERDDWDGWTLLGGAVIVAIAVSTKIAFPVLPIPWWKRVAVGAAAFVAWTLWLLWRRRS